MNFVKEGGIPRTQPRHNVAEMLFGEKTPPISGSIVLIRTSEQSDKLAFQSFNHRTLEGCFTMRAVQIDEGLDEKTNLQDVRRALDDGAGLLVVTMYDGDHAERMKYKMEAEALKYAAQRQIPVLMIMPSWDHVYRRQLGAAVLANVRSVFLQFQRDSRTNTLTENPKQIFKKIDEDNILYWPQWQGREAVRACLRRIVRKRVDPQG